MSQPVTPTVSRPPSPSQSVLDPVSFIEAASNHYAIAHDETVRLRVQDKEFSVPKSRLIIRSPVFRDMFTLSADGGEEREVVELYDDPEEFNHFLWYIHADPLAAHEFSVAAPTPKKCTILLGIASTAHRYQATDVANWAMRLVLGILMDGQRPSMDRRLAIQLLRTAARFQDTETELFLTNARDVVCDAMHPDRPGPLSEDPIAAILAAQEANDSYVLGHAYFYTLQKDNDYWRTDDALSALDRRRLVCGGLVLGQRQALLLPQRLPPQRSWPPSPRGWGPRAPSPDPYRQPEVWKPFLHPNISDCRDELWVLFDSDPWRLV